MDALTPPDPAIRALRAPWVWLRLVRAPRGRVWRRLGLC